MKTTYMLGRSRNMETINDIISLLQDPNELVGVKQSLSWA